MDNTSDDNSDGSNGSGNKLFDMGPPSNEDLSGHRNIDTVAYTPYADDDEIPSLNGPGSGRTDGGVDGGGLGDLIKKASDSAGRVGDKLIDAGENYLNQEIDNTFKKPTQGGAEYTLLDTIMLVLIILAILMLLYVVLAESGVLSVAESGANYLITTHTD